MRVTMVMLRFVVDVVTPILIGAAIGFLLSPKI
jgi:F0F1-type ATP synthase assembly protein I